MIGGAKAIWLPICFHSAGSVCFFVWTRFGSGLGVANAKYGGGMLVGSFSCVLLGGVASAALVGVPLIPRRGVSVIISLWTGWGWVLVF
jgi:hypothetical protein